MTITGSELGDEKFKRLQEHRWVQIGPNVYECEKHKTFFNPSKEPCWACYNETTEEGDAG